MMAGINVPGILQKIVASGQSSIAHVEQRVDVHTAPEQYYFVLDLIEDLSTYDALQQAATTELSRLEPGKSYWVRVSASPDSSGETFQQSITIRSDIELVLRSSHDSVIVENPRRVVQREVIEDFTHDFRINVAPECPIIDVTLDLCCRKASSQGRPRQVARLTLSLNGTYSPVDEQLLEATHIALDASLPEGIAIIHIEDGLENLRLTGWSYRNWPLRIDSFPRPTISLATFVEHQIPPANVRNEVRVLSRCNPPRLIRWLTRLLQRHGEHLSIIITDHTGSDFPWEMMELDVEQEGEIPLGAIAVIVRWLPVQFYESWYYLQMQDDACTGDVIVHLDQAEGVPLDIEQESFDQFSTSYYTHLDEVRQRLSHSLQSVGLVYLGCHGLVVDRDHREMVEREIQLGSLTNPSERLVPIELEIVGRHQELRPVVFVNACHSGRLIRDSMHRLRGLPEVFLARVARGYIGTLGPVESAYAAQIVQAMSQAVSAVDGGIRIGEFLRRLRAEAVKRLRENETRENWLRYIYTFMYVYYGNPLIRLRLTPAGARDEAGVDE
jgi:hypothetical protein